MENCEKIMLHCERFGGGSARVNTKRDSFISLYRAWMIWRNRCMENSTGMVATTNASTAAYTDTGMIAKLSGLGYGDGFDH
jgi:hypothetical protein